MRIDTIIILAVLFLAACMPQSMCFTRRFANQTSYTLPLRRMYSRSVDEPETETEIDPENVTEFGVLNTTFPHPDTYFDDIDEDPLESNIKDLDEYHKEETLSRKRMSEFHSFLRSKQKFGVPLNIKEMQELLIEGGRAIECCPTVKKITQPVSGKLRTGRLARLYSSEFVIQTFEEEFCLKGVKNKACLFLDKKIHNQSKCKQKYGFVNALVENPHYIPPSHRNRHHRHLANLDDPYNIKNSSHHPWTLELIQIKTGCTCEVYPKEKKKKTITKKQKIKKNQDDSN